MKYVATHIQRVNNEFLKSKLIRKNRVYITYKHKFTAAYTKYIKYTFKNTYVNVYSKKNTHTHIHKQKQL